MKELGILRPLVLLASVASAACGGDPDGDGGSGGPALLAQAPHCSSSADELRIEGTLDGTAIDDVRTVNINAGLANTGDSYFESPLFDIAALEANQLGVRLEWQGSLAYGDTASASGGTLAPPANHPSAGQTLCITAGEIGFVDGGSEDGVFKFAISGARAGLDCSGAEVPVELRGCYN